MPTPRHLRGAAGEEVRQRLLASASLWATAAISDSVRKPIAGSASAMRGRRGSGHSWSAARSGRALGEGGSRSPAPRRRTRVLRDPEPLAGIGVVDRPVSIMSRIRVTPISRGSRTEARRRRRSALLALRQGVERAVLGHPQMRRQRQLEPAPDHRALERRHHRHAAELDLVEGAVPHPRMHHPAAASSLGQLGEVESGAEMRAVRRQHQGAHVLRQRADDPLQPSTMPSSRALRLAGRASVTTATAPGARRAAIRCRARQARPAWWILPHGSGRCRIAKPEM